MVRLLRGALESVCVSLCTLYPISALACVSGAQIQKSVGEAGPLTEEEVEKSDDPETPAFVPIQTPLLGPEAAEQDSLHPDGFSAVINSSILYSRSEFNSALSRSIFDELILNFEPSIRSEIFGGITINSEGRLVWTRDHISDEFGIANNQSVEFQRGFTSLEKEFPTTAIRATLGDVFARPVNFQGSTRLLGLSIARDYRAIQPRRNVLPTGRKTFLIERPSRVQIYADDSLVRQEFLSPGAFDIEGFANELGTQRIELEIRDNTGRSERIKFSALTSAPRLSEGILDFGISAGVPAFGRIDGPQYNFEEAVVSGFVQYGLNSSVNIGADFQADKFVAMMGASAIFSSRIGSVTARSGVSKRFDDGFDLAIGATFASPVISDLPHITLDFEFLGENFSRIGENSFQSIGDFSLIFDPKFVFTGSVSHPITKSLHVSLGGDWRRIRPNPTSPLGSPNFTEQWSSYLAANQRISKKLSFNVTVSADKFSNETGNNFSAFLSLRRFFGDQVTADLSYNTRTNSSAFSVARDPKHSINRTYAQFRAEHVNDDPESFSLSADVDYEGNRFSGYGYHFEDRRVGDSVSRDTYLQLNSAIAFADGAIGVGRQVSGTGYAVVKKFPHDPEDQIYVDDWGDGEYRAKSDILGPAFVNDIIPYINQTITISTRKPANTNDETSDETSDEAEEDDSFVLDVPETALSSDVKVYVKPYGGIVIKPSDATLEKIDEMPKD